ncbi:MAG: glutamine synthetase family protein [Acidimicrobiales bacterium]
MNETMSAESFHARCREAGVHTVEVAAPDTQGHLRGKRVPVDRFFAHTVENGVNIADAMFVFDMQNDLPDNPYVNMDSGFLDCNLKPDMTTGRLLTHRPGYAIVFADTYDMHGHRHPLAPRNVLANQIERCREAGLDPVVATELEFYLCHPDWTPIQSHIQYSSLTDALEVEEVLEAMRRALAGAGLEVESSNAEYGPGQFEINIGHANAMTCADNTVLFKSIVKQVAVQNGLRATFMPKPWADQSGSGMHVHTSLLSAGANAFADSDGTPNQLMSNWIAGLIEHAEAMTLLGAPTANGPKRIRPYTFAPTHINWGLDNRTVMCRSICEAGSRANRVEFRSAGADANPYVVIAGIIAAGTDGVERSLQPPAMSEGDMYTNPGDCVALPADLRSCVDAFVGSQLAGRLGEEFSTVYACIAEHEIALAADNSPDEDDVNDWDRARYAEHC